MSFYAILNKTVIDGTPCTRPISSTGKPAPHGTRGVCVLGQCKVSNFKTKNCALIVKNICK